MKLTRQWTGKKQPTNPEKKERHVARKHKRAALFNLKDTELEQEIIEYKKHAN